MSSRERVVKVMITGDASRFNKATKEAESSAQRMSSAFSSMSSRIAALGAGFFGANLLRGAVQQASALQETVAKSGTVFGENAKDIEKWAQTSAKSVLLSKQQAMEAAATYGNLFRGVGLNTSKAAGLSKSLVQLAADLASFNNTSIEDALAALQSGISGESEPLKKYGVLLNETLVKEKAQALGLVKKGQALDEVGKVEARYAVILERTALAQGDVARTGGGLANQQRQLSANWKDLQANLGVALIPGLTAVTTALNAMGPAGLQTLIMLGGLTFAVTKLSGAFKMLGSAFTLATANPMLLALAAVAAALVLIVTHAKEVQDVLGGIFYGPAKGIINAFGGNLGQGTTSLGPASYAYLNKRAMGGPTLAGMPYLVGERGPELFVPSQSGTVVPNHAMGGGMVVNQYVTVQASNPYELNRALERSAASAARAAGR